MLREDAQIRLFPVLIRQISEEDSMVYRIGGAKITSVATSKVGAQAIRILRKGKTIREVRGLLCRQLGIEESRLNLQPVFDAILQANMVRQVDRDVLVTEKPQVRRILTQSLHFALQLLKNPLRGALIRWLPLGVSHRLLFFLARRSRPSPQLRRNLDGAWGGLLPPRTLEEMASRHTAEHLRSHIDTCLLRNLNPRKLTRWLEGATITGLERVQALQRAGSGAILCGFHFSAPQLLGPLLWRHGLSFTGAASIPPFRGKILPPKFVLDSTYAPGGVPGCGTLTWYTRFSFRGFLEIMKAVEAGGTVLVYPDGYFDRPNRDIARYFGHLVAEYKPSRISVPFLGGSIQANSMVPWLWVETRAPLFPVKVLRRSAAAYEVVIEEPLELGQISSVQAAAEKIYAALERDIHLHPAPWNYWGLLHEINVPHEEAKEIAGAARSRTGVRSARKPDDPDGLIPHERR